ncbi:MAG: ASCH domain-containing protein [Crenarchaeota archaeon]|nr:ASCH domain-containing protein [Thermoproteota archaeon]
MVWDPPTIHFRLGTGSVEKAERGLKLATRRPYTDTNIYYFRRLVGRIVRLYEGGKYTHAVITDVYIQRLGEMSDEDARAEGFSDLESFRRVWSEIYGSFNPEQRVVVISWVPYGCWRFYPSNKRISISGVEAPLCSYVDREGLGRGCSFCWLSPVEWCGNCRNLRVTRGGRRLCRALGEAVEVRSLRVNPRVQRRCEFYARSIPRVVERGFERLRSKGVKIVK